MKKYNLVVLVKSDVKDEALDKLTEKVDKMVKAVEGKSAKFTEMGHKQLAYKIKKQGEAVFLNWSLEVPPAGVVQLDRKLTLDREVLRHLLVAAE